MALLWIESFDHDFTNAASVAQKGYVQTGTGWQSQTGRYQGSALGAVNGSPGTAKFKTPNLGNSATMILGFSFMIQNDFSGSLAEQVIATFFDGANEQLALYIVGTNGKYQFRIKRGSTTLGTTTNSWRGSFWLWVEIKVVFDTTGSNGSVELRVNQVSEFLLENTDTTNHTSTIANQVEIAATRFTGNHDTYFDDLFILDGTGGSLNNFLGDRAVEGKLPNASGNRNQWNSSSGGGHSTDVDEASIDSDTSYLWIPNTSDGQVELFGFPDLTAIQGTVHAVFLYWDLRMDTNGSDKVRPIFRNGGGTEDVGTEVTIDEDATYIRFSEKFLLDPTIDAAWTVSNFNAMQMGLESRAV